MIDDLSIRRLFLLHPSLRDKTIDLYKNRIAPALTGDYFCRIIYTYRSLEQQTELYAQGRSKLFDKDGKRLGIVTKAKPGQSWHNFSLAIDFCLVNKSAGVSWEVVKDYDKDGKADWQEVVDIFKSEGWKWGGDWSSFKDYPHLEFPTKYNIKDIFAKYENGDTFVDPKTNIKYVNL